MAPTGAAVGGVVRAGAVGARYGRALLRATLAGDLGKLAPSEGAAPGQRATGATPPDGERRCLHRGLLAGFAERRAGTAGRWIFLAGLRGAAFTSMLGGWQGIPSRFAAVVRAYRGGDTSAPADARSPCGGGAPLFLALPPMLPLLTGRPIRVVPLYSATGALFMPFLAATRPYLNDRRVHVGPAKTGVLVNALLGGAPVRFPCRCYTEAAGAF